MRRPSLPQILHPTNCAPTSISDEEDDGSDEGSDVLGEHVGDNLPPGKLAYRRHSNRDGRVQMSPCTVKRMWGLMLTR